MFVPKLKRVPEWLRLAAAALLLAVAAAYAAAHLLPLPERLDVADSQVVTWRDGRAAHVFLSADDKRRIPVALERVDPAYVEALIALEDERFWDHPGVDPVAVGRAALSNIQHGQVVSGGSTITMQLVRLLEPRPRTLVSKAIEAFRAVQLEMFMSKQEILEAYLRFVPYGGNLEGIESASLAYFGHSADALSDAQIATLLAVPQNPGVYKPSRDNAEDLAAARNKIVRKLLRDEAVDLGSGDHTRDRDEVVELVASEPVPTEILELPRDIPHVAYWLRQRRPGQPRIITTLERHLQSDAEEMLAAREAEARLDGVHNAAVVLADHRAGEVRALVGNFEFFDDRHGGQIPGFDVRRSTGSLMKPFLYAQAIDEGRMAPEHLEPDVPVTYGAYSPENFQYQYSGLVRMDEALARSLNVPFVNLLAEVGVDRFAETLRQLGLHRLNPAPGEQGLSLAVGGVEATPLEVAELYAAMANDGRATPLKLVLDEPVVSDEPEHGEPGDREPASKQRASAFGQAAVWKTRQALRRRDRPDFPARRHGTGAAPEIFWKTGTSAANRDAWSAGSGGTYTGVVWMGNFSNASSEHLVGSVAAAPVLFDTLEGVIRPRHTGDPAPADALETVEVCAFSGHMPNEACEHTVETHVPRHAVPTETCPYHIRVDVDVESGRALSPTCRQDFEYETRSFVELPAQVRRWMRARLGDVSQPPAAHPDCRAATRESKPRISSPPANQTLVMRPGVDAAEQKIPLEAQVGRGVGELSWFVDGEFLGRAPVGDRIWWTPAPGEHEIVVMAADGGAASRKLVVR
ncbi:MAG: penicillin-binding protein 1C [Myxococcota bacterium]